MITCRRALVVAILSLVGAIGNCQQLVQGKLVRIDKENLILLIDVNRISDIAGKVSLTTSQRRAIRLSKQTHIYKEGKPAHWLSVSILKKDQDAAVLVTDPGEGAWIGQSVILPPTTVPDLDPPLGSVIEADEVCMEEVVVPMIFPLSGKVRWSDTFLASRGGGSRRHKGQDLMANKLTQVVAAFDGTIRFGKDRGNAGNTITIQGDHGWIAQYYHINNDTPGTDDGLGSDDYAFLGGLKDGDRVTAGQLIGWCGDSGNAEGTAPHVHFELWNAVTGACYNAAASLKAATKLSQPNPAFPFPDWLPSQGKARIDGAVRHVDLARGVIILDLWAETPFGERIEFVKVPRRKYVLGQAGDQFFVPGSDEPLSMEDLQIGQRLTLMTSISQSGEAAELYEAFLASQPVELSLPSIPQPSPAPASSKPASNLLTEINHMRRENGLEELRWDTSLAQTAEDYAAQMMNGDFFQLTDPASGSSVADLAQKKYQGKVTGVISQSRDSASLTREVVEGFPELLLDPDLRSIGFGHAYLYYDTGRVKHQHYWCLLFGK